MEEEEPNSPTINKTIFLVGDATLVLLGLILAYSIEGFTTPWVILCLCLGALFGSTPYLIEFFSEKQFYTHSDPPAIESLRHSILQLSHQIQDLQEAQNQLSAKQSEQAKSKPKPDLNKEIQALKEKHHQLEKQLKEQKSLLESNNSETPSSTDSPPPVGSLLNRAFTQNTDLETTGKWSQLIQSPSSSSDDLKAKTPSSDQLPKKTPELESSATSNEIKEPPPSTAPKEPDLKTPNDPIPQEEWFASETIEPTPEDSPATTGTTTLLAKTLIGIGNKPYLRGEGGGLSWKKGIPMNFKEIGQWQWQSPNNQETITCQIYKNDQTPSQGEKITLQPGQTLEINPVF